MAEMFSCPSPDLIAKVARDELADDLARTVEQHLTGCRACLDRLFACRQRPLTPQVPECHIAREIGRGRFGVVYKGWWRTGKPRIIAVKVLSLPGDLEKSRFDREIAVLKAIDLPGIVKCLGSGGVGDSKYHIMEFVDGIHLDEYCASSDLDLPTKLRVFERVCNAIAAAHAKGIVHRDLKPRNILIDTNGRPHILDFGICAITPAAFGSLGRHTITQVGDLLGTLKYMSPEQAWGGLGGAISERTDVWALGVMLYELVTGGDYPYELGPTEDKSAHEALLERVRKESPKRPRLHGIDRGHELETLVERCLAWEVDQRIESAARLAEDLGRFLVGQPIRTKPHSLRYRARRLAIGLSAKSRWAVLLMSIAMSSLALWVVVFVCNVRWKVTGHALVHPPVSRCVDADPCSTRDDILVVGIFDDTIDAVLAVARDQHIGEVKADIRTWRAVHGFLMERLARADPRVVVWDYYFCTPHGGDAGFVHGARKLRDAGTPIVLAVLTYKENGAPDLSPAISELLKEGVGHGGILARDMVDRPGEFIVAVKRTDEQILPSLSLSTLAAVLHPDCELDVDWTGRSRWLDMLYRRGPDSYVGERHRIELTRAFAGTGNEQLIRAGDLLACKSFGLERPSQWKKRTVSYHKLLALADDELCALVKAKVLVIGDFRTNQAGCEADRHRVKFGPLIVKEVPSSYLLADSIAGLMDNIYMRSAFPLRPTTFLLTLLSAAVGCIVPIGLARKRWLKAQLSRRVLWTALARFRVAPDDV
ncbi:MAG: protein kinase domain-containing protein [Planctomycetota bacterium]|jgi:predicted Ser/Thr protein kinase